MKPTPSFSERKAAVITWIGTVVFTLGAVLFGIRGLVGLHACLYTSLDATRNHDWGAGRLGDLLDRMMSLCSRPLIFRLQRRAACHALMETIQSTPCRQCP